MTVGSQHVERQTLPQLGNERFPLALAVGPQHGGWRRLVLLVVRRRAAQSVDQRIDERSSCILRQRGDRHAPAALRAARFSAMV